jgi:hypothetical protein
VSRRYVALGRQVGDTPERLTGAAATATGCELVRAGDAGVDRHPGLRRRTGVAPPVGALG